MDPSASTAPSPRLLLSVFRALSYTEYRIQNREFRIPNFERRTANCERRTANDDFEYEHDRGPPNTPGTPNPNPRTKRQTKYPARILEKQNSLQMMFPHISHFRSICFSRILQARPLHHVDAAPNPTLIPLTLAGLRPGLASA